MLILPASLKLFLLYVSGCLACCVPGLHACACAGQKRTSRSLELGSQIIVSHRVDSGDWTLVLEKAASPLKPWVIFIIFSIWMCQLFLPSVTFFLQLGWVYWKCFIHFSFPALYYHTISISLLNWSSMLLTFYWHHWFCHSLCLIFPLCCQRLSPALSCPHLFVFVCILFQANHLFSFYLENLWNFIWHFVCLRMCKFYS